MHFLPWLLRTWASKPVYKTEARARRITPPDGGCGQNHIDSISTERTGLHNIIRAIMADAYSIVQACSYLSVCMASCRRSGRCRVFVQQKRGDQVCGVGERQSHRPSPVLSSNYRTVQCSAVLCTVSVHECYLQQCVIAARSSRIPRSSESITAQLQRACASIASILASSTVYHGPPAPAPPHTPPHTSLCNHTQ